MNKKGILIVVSGFSGAGKGTLMKEIMKQYEKFIHVKFTLGEKKFIFPDAFLMGFLEVEW